jgi:hypothetical protein
LSRSALYFFAVNAAFVTLPRNATGSPEID